MVDLPPAEEPITVEPVELAGGQRIFAHDLALCAGRACAVHDPSDHHMADWPQHFRDPRVEAMTYGLHPGLMERVCPHGIGHPDPDHMAWYASCHTPEETSAEGTHGCDGCCYEPTEH